jgi:hypothetical protein
MQEPNYSEWKQRQLWTLVEASCLLSGIEPVPPEQFNKDSRSAGIPRTIYADLKDAIDLKQLSFLPSRDAYLRGRRVKPDECVTWAVGRKYAIPDALLGLGKRDPAETREQRADRLRRRVAEEKSKGNKAFLKTVAKEEGISETRLKQLLGPAKTPAKNTAGPWSALSSRPSKATPTKHTSKY